MQQHHTASGLPRYQTQPRGFILLTVLVFLLLASLLSLADLRTMATQQRMVATLYDAEREFNYTESALITLESYAIRELENISARSSYAGGDPNANNDNPAAGTSDTACVSTTCKTGVTSCSYCLRPSPSAKSRLLEPKTGLPWASVTLSFPVSDAAGVTSSSETKSFYNYMEYLGKAPCDFTGTLPVATYMGTYGNLLCPGGTVNGAPRCDATLRPPNYNCPVMRVTVSNQPASPLGASITLQSTVIGSYGGFPAKRISFRQVLP